MNTVKVSTFSEELMYILPAFRTISLKEMEAVELMSRFDSKYIFHRSLLPSFLKQLQINYKVLRVDHSLLFRYENLYFDTADLQSYVEHHNGKSGRFKVRFRKYVNNNQSFFEVKQKTNKGLTQKSRLNVSDFRKELSSKQLQFVKEQLHGKEPHLLPQLSNDFSRITLVNEADHERVTIDLLIHFENGASERSLDELIIAEVKQNHPTSLSVFKKLMMAQRIFPTSISKYCLGTLLTHPGIKYNRFKPKLTILNKICDVAY